MARNNMLLYTMNFGQISKNLYIVLCNNPFNEYETLIFYDYWKRCFAFGHEVTFDLLEVTSRIEKISFMIKFPIMFKNEGKQ